MCDIKAMINTSGKRSHILLFGDFTIKYLRKPSLEFFEINFLNQGEALNKFHKVPGLEEFSRKKSPLLTTVRWADGI